MGAWLRCPRCGELFELEHELENHYFLEHVGLSEKPRKTFEAQIQLVIKANSTKEVEKILNLIANLELPAVIKERILKRSYTDEAGQPIVEEVTDVDWTH